VLDPDARNFGSAKKLFVALDPGARNFGSAKKKRCLLRWILMPVTSKVQEKLFVALDPDARNFN